MIAFIDVVDTGFAARTDAAGRASFTGVPGGPVLVRVWHPWLRAPGNQLELRVDGSATMAPAPRPCRSTCGRRRGRCAATERVHARIRTRLAVLYAGLFALALSLVAAALYVVVTTTAERQVRGELVASAPCSTGCSSCAPASSAMPPGLLSRDFGFRAAVATGDPGTALSALDNLKARLGLRTAFIVGMDGNVTGLADPRLRADAPRALGRARRRPGPAASRGSAACPTMSSPRRSWRRAWSAGWCSPTISARRRCTGSSSCPPSRSTRGCCCQRHAWTSGWHGPDDAAIAGFVDAPHRRQRARPGSTRRAAPPSRWSRPLRAMGDGESAALLLRYPLARGDGALSAAADRDGADRPARPDARRCSARGGCR